MKDKICDWLARHLPARLIYWCCIKLGADTTTGEYDTTIVPELGLIEAIDRYAKMHKLWQAPKESSGE